MKKRSTIAVVVIVLGLLLLGPQLIVLGIIPAINRPMQSRRMNEISSMADALYAFAKTNNNQFPDRLSDVIWILNERKPSSTGLTWESVLNDYVYLKPLPHQIGEVDHYRIFLAEKLSHYWFMNGGYVLHVGSWFPKWAESDQYQRLLDHSRSDSRN